MLAEREPGSMPWGDLGVDVVIESTGFFTKRDGAQQHLDAGAKKVVISAPATDPDMTSSSASTTTQYDKDAHHIVSNASCTTNCVAPVTKVLHDAFTIEQGFMTTIHAYTNDQRLARPAAQGPAARAGRRDQPDPDLDRRRARDRARHARPEGQGRRHLGARPGPDRLDRRLRRATVGRETSVDEVNEAFRAAAESGPLAGLSSSTRRRRSSRRTSRRTRTRRSSTAS